MTKRHSLVALVPMRHASERVPGKNYRPLRGRPLYEYILETLHQVPEIARIVVDTDSQKIMEGVRQTFPQVRLLERPSELRGGHVSMNAVLLHDVQQVEADFYLQTHSTNPLLSAQSIRQAIAAFLDQFPEIDSLFSVTRIQNRLWSSGVEPINHDPGELIRTQDLDPIFMENSCLYIFERQRFLSRENRIGARPKMFEIPPEEGLDIDDEYAFRIAAALMADRANP